MSMQDAEGLTSTSLLLEDGRCKLSSLITNDGDPEAGHVPLIVCLSVPYGYDIRLAENPF